MLPPWARCHGSVTTVLQDTSASPPVSLHQQWHSISQCCASTSRELRCSRRQGGGILGQGREKAGGRQIGRKDWRSSAPPIQSLHEGHFILTLRLFLPQLKSACWVQGSYSSHSGTVGALYEQHRIGQEDIILCKTSALYYTGHNVGYHLYMRLLGWITKAITQS